jgi:hypothetical protein
MTAAWFLQTLVASPFFASRAFLAAFVTALAARFGPGLPWFGGSRAIEAVAHAPPWFTHDGTLALLGALAALEILATKSQDARRLMDEIDAWAKAGLSLAVSLAILSPDDAALVPVAQAGFGGAALAVVPALLTLVLARSRGRFFAFLGDVDDADDLGLQRLLLWAEDGWVVFGLTFSILFPALALVLFLVTLGGLAAVTRGVRWLDDRKREACAACGEPVHPSAPHCASCRAPVEAPAKVGVFGQARPARARNLDAHGLELVSRKRCSFCAERLRGRGTSLRCEACGTVTFAGSADLDRYLAHLDRQLPKTVAICFLFSAVPLLGIVPGILYYRLSLVSGLVRYVPPTAGFATRWVVRAMNVVLICLQPIPIVGAFLLPAMCVGNYALYRRALVGGAPAALTSPGRPPSSSTASS